jgi:hypothetical protein
MAWPFSMDEAMTDGVEFEYLMPFSWRPGGEADMAHGPLMAEALLVLNAINHMESQPESSHGEPAAGGDNARLSRVEAKLDLALNLLARTLGAPQGMSNRMVRLGPEEIAWAETNPPEPGTPLILELCPSPVLPVALRLPAESLPPEPGLARARLSGLPEALDASLHQFIFRRHRQAIRDKHASQPPS